MSHNDKVHEIEKKLPHANDLVLEQILKLLEQNEGKSETEMILDVELDDIFEKHGDLLKRLAK